MKKKICVVTGTRAEYGLLKPLLIKLKKDLSFELQLIVTGSHLSEEFGNTYLQIEKDGFDITEKVQILSGSDSDVGVSKTMGLAMTKFADVLEKLKPDLIVLLGDRYELMAIASVATIMKIPIAHLHGGEATEGAYDEAFRHSITKMSYLHFAGAEEYRKRIIQLGENPERVFNVGAIGTENILNLKLLSKNELEKQLKVNLPEKYFVVVFHSVTLERQTSKDQIFELIKAIEKSNVNVVFIKGNADSSGKIINDVIEKFIKENPEKYICFSSISNFEYLNLLKNSEGLIGNSSSGIAETPTLNVGTLNIGDRQKGRIQSDATLNCECISNEIVKNIEIMKTDKYKEFVKISKSPYGEGGVSDRIIYEIKQVFVKGINLKKKFYDL
ncbi:MAG: UDP-N-acetylglucosamine 2-epimerase [Fusobacteriaceae bacterium]